MTDTVSTGPARPARPLSERMARVATSAYLWIFFFYLFAPLAVMAAATFNVSRFPTITPWQGFTLQWFGELWRDRQMWQALQISLINGAGVIAISVPLGLAAALMLGALHRRARSTVYALMVSPLLTPGVIIGISTLVFWRRFDVSGGIFLTIVAQSSYITAYVMLMVTARMQRFDTTLEEAGLDLGATHWQVFRRITLPFLVPTIAAAAFIAFLQSFENYNTTLFVRGFDTPLTVYIASKVRTGVTPALNALGLVLIVTTFLVAGLVEWRRRIEARRAADLRPPTDVG